MAKKLPGKRRLYQSQMMTDSQIEHKREANRRWRAKYPERQLAASNRWREKHRDRVRAAAHARYEANPEIFRVKSRRFSGKKHREIKSQLVVYKGGKCFDCGGSFPDCCFDFDHQDPKDKSFCVCSEFRRPLQELKAEADKCDLVCSNCHRIRTAGNPEIAKKMSAAALMRSKNNLRI